MSATSKNNDALRIKTKRTCAISGIQGTHPLQVGVAYFYRGHYIYSCPAGNPIEPIPFSTKKGISILGTVVDRAPLYDPYASNLIPEPAIAALDRALFHLAEDQREQKAKQKEEVAQALEQEEERETVDKKSGEQLTLSVVKESRSQPVSRVGSSTMLSRMLQPESRAKSQTCLPSFLNQLVVPPRDDVQVSTFLAPSVPSLTAYAPTTIDNTNIFTPHDRAQFLAYSAPGSRFASNNNTPHASRPVSPNHGLGLRGALRPTASTSRLNNLLLEAGVRRDLNPLLEFSEERYTYEQLDAVIKNLPCPSSRPQSHAHNPDGPEQTDNALYYRGSSPFDESYTPTGQRTPKPPATHESNRDRAVSMLSTDAQPPSRTHSPTSTMSLEVPSRYLYLPCLGHTENTLPQHEPTKLSAFASQETLRQSALPSPTYWNGEKPLGLGRPRRASFLLNELYNATHPPLTLQQTVDLSYVNQYNDALSSISSHCARDGLSPPVSIRMPKCQMPFHDDSCDGTTTTNKHLTQRAREGKGFKDLYPTIVCADERVMIDWDMIMQKERAAAGYVAV